MGTRSYKKKIRKSIVIIGEGLTEYRYVDDIRTEERYRFSLVPGIPKHPDLDDIVNLATRRLNEGNDYVLCLVYMDVINNSFDKKELYYLTLMPINLPYNDSLMVFWLDEDIILMED